MGNCPNHDLSVAKPMSKEACNKFKMILNL